MIFFIAALHGIVLSFLVANHKKYGKPQSNKILGLAILFFSCCLAEYGLYTSGLFLKVPYLVTSTNPLLFSIPPLIYLYVKSRMALSIQRSDYSIFSVALIYLILALPFYTLSSKEKLNIFSQTENNYIIFHKFWAFYYLILWVIFGGLGLQVVSRIKLENNSSRRELKWIKSLLLTFMMVALLDVGFYFLGELISTLKVTTAYITTSIHALMIYTLGYLVILNPKILFNQKNARYQHSSLSDNSSQRLSLEIIAYMEIKKPYLDGNLRMGQLAEALSISTNQLSQVLNQELNKNFNEFINEYRVAEVKQKLHDSKCDHLTMVAIAQDSGFNSKNAFNRAFKYYTGKTPSQYKKSIKASSKTKKS